MRVKTEKQQKEGDEEEIGVKFHPRKLGGPVKKEIVLKGHA